VRTPRNLGRILLAVWFVLYGLLMASFLHLSFAHAGDVLAVLAVVVGVLIFLER